ncbi:MAG TPA: ADP-ribosylation factor-like protein [Candidatus Nanopelagicaceae bacterium]|nr:ADP-ribosylation factor-like protein [Candidatus Nanopelagicaceae bacterium]
MPSRRGDGTLVFKICFYGPSLGGKTTALEWVYNREGLASGDMQQIQDPTGRTLFFDRVVARVSNVVFQVYTVAGQRRHKFQRQTVLKGTDAVIFTWDSLIDQFGENIWSLKELLKFYGDRLIPAALFDPPEVPIVVLANKRDLEDIVEISKLRQVLDTAKLNHCLIYETIAITGVNVKRAFVYAARQAVLNHYKKLSGKAMETS